ncbi:EAL domain-containing protein [Pantoea stewartii]|uniref:EAL domain-containing protein n=1 Tax=Pantoea stewartii TaxID=66269 RepID=A0AB34VAW8_9GAMM|nr:EAL domain-containing protein [Pantoea stewartii]KTS71422.1 hypothetical protein RSA30_18115 [Pantoea stewartii]KTS94525.1 hypothetical protein RSA13_17665 [Pantoea stewartii]KTT08152.1 hypothetical protein RSA36_09635 [Pantoea stewartii]
MLKKINGIRLQPIVRLEDNTVAGYEVLSKITSDDNVERFFNALPEKDYVTLLMRQLEIIHGGGMNETLFVNLPLRIFLNRCELDFFVQREAAGEKKINIEVQDAFLLEKVSSLQKRNVIKAMDWCRSHGYDIWLDDYTAGMGRWLNNTAMAFDGIKTDYREIRRFKTKALAMKPLVDEAKQFTKRILIERIETGGDLRYARASGATLGQGYLWPERVILTTVV